MSVTSCSVMGYLTRPTRNGCNDQRLVAPLSFGKGRWVRPARVVAPVGPDRVIQRCR